MMCRARCLAPHSSRWHEADEAPCLGEVRPDGAVAQTSRHADPAEAWSVSHVLLGVATAFPHQRPPGTRVTNKVSAIALNNTRPDPRSALRETTQ